MSFDLRHAAFAPMLVGAVVLSTFPALAAGSHSGSHGGAPFGEPGDASEASRTVEVVMLDVSFEPKKIAVLQGETVRFIVRNEGTVVHEFNIGTPKMHAQHQEEMQVMVEQGVIDGAELHRNMMKKGSGDGHVMAHDDPNSVLLEPGGSAEIVWTFGKSMDLEFACNVPGHYDAGMAGDFRFVDQRADR